ncbi:MAG: 30S ribosomal protein S8 [Candidatus Peribacteraceae bacterium]|nr:30S ribosomal protein S8 [Candidatus Peribacteraceae bacterium]MDD5740206.1 30S ribosomal protein S8 [Candidatus Peribacteraceae bacterium]
MTPVNDPIGDLLTRVRNAQSAGRTQCRASLSKIKLQLCELLVREGLLQSVTVEGTAPKQELVVSFLTDHPVLALKRVSTPGRRVYRSVEELKPVENGFGIAILTTSRGLITDREARLKKIGGELLCEIS